MTFNWGTGAAAAYLAFATATGGFVAFAMMRPVSLVRPDYYADSLREDQHIAARRNALSLKHPASITSNDRDWIRVAVPADQAGNARGSITLYRASDPVADRTIALTIDRSGEQHVAVAGIARGQWVVQLRWSADGREYYVEQPVMLR